MDLIDTIIMIYINPLKNYYFKTRELFTRPWSLHITEIKQKRPQNFTNEGYDNQNYAIDALIEKTSSLHNVIKPTSKTC